MTLRRYIAAVLAGLLAAGPSFAAPLSADPTATTRQTGAVQAQMDAQWAELEAERRATDGDYDGAVQAHQQADNDLRVAAQLRRSEFSERRQP